MEAWVKGLQISSTQTATLDNKNLVDIKDCNVHVYERDGDGFKRISAFDRPDCPERKTTIRVLYCGGVHYDALVDEEGEWGGEEKVPVQELPVPPKEEQYSNITLTL
ncbi:hypothetical protein B484DRAFT_409483 [Ochromonadaceae sp. CCMP2298]|nr:hypothetical protein B484DRAFT_409483 [Ochromonadaceae sp. CCMP2298]